MGLWTRAGMVISAVAGFLGLSHPPASDAERLARIEALYGEYRSEFPAVPEFTPEEILQSAGPQVFVDVRTERERAISTIPGAVPAEEIEQDRSLYQGVPLVAYCTIGYRSGRWAAEQRERGLDVVNLAGSLLAWTHAGGPLQGPQGPTRQVHVYAPSWDLVASDYVAVW